MDNRGRRRFLGGLAAAFFMPLATAEGQPVRRVGWLWDTSAGTPPAEWLKAFRQGLQEHGWIDGRNVVLETRSSSATLKAEQRDAALQALAAELLALKVDVLVANPVTATQAARQASDTVTIVFAGVSDPIHLGLVASLSRPGGNVTGLSYLGVELNAKRLQLLKEAIPRAKDIGVLVPATHPLRQRMGHNIEAAAQTLGLRLHLKEIAITDPAEHIDRAVRAMADERVDAVLGLQGPHVFRERRRLADLAAKYRLPGVFELSSYAEAGCLMAYAPSSTDLYRRAATYVDRILKGAKPADLPVEQPTKFELIINRKTAKALGLTIPPSVLARADQVIE